MLKWTVIQKRGNEKPDQRRHSTAGICSTPITSKDPMSAVRSTEKQRRRSAATRRSSTSRRRSNHNRNSLDFEADKENQFTSTPIKSSDENFQGDAFRDVSNLTPQNTVNRRALSAKKLRNEKRLLEKELSPVNPKQKKKKRCLDPSHSQEFFLSPTNFFKPFETVDSHIEAVSVKDIKVCPCKTATPGKHLMEKRMQSKASAIKERRYSAPKLRKLNSTPELEKLSSQGLDSRFRSSERLEQLHSPEKLAEILSPQRPENRHLELKTVPSLLDLEKISSVFERVDSPDRRFFSSTQLEKSLSPPQFNKRTFILSPSLEVRLHQHILPTIDKAFPNRPFNGYQNILEDKPIQGTFAPTLPAHTMDFSPCPTRRPFSYPTLHPTPARVPAIFHHHLQTNGVKLEDICPPNKKAKIDHVNDFLHQISSITSPEDDRLPFPSFETEQCPGLHKETTQGRLSRRRLDIQPEARRSLQSAMGYVNAETSDQIETGCPQTRLLYGETRLLPTDTVPIQAEIRQNETRYISMETMHRFRFDVENALPIQHQSRFQQQNSQQQNSHQQQHSLQQQNSFQQQNSHQQQNSLQQQNSQQRNSLQHKNSLLLPNDQTIHDLEEYNRFPQENNFQQGLTYRKEDIKISPLVKRFVDMRFSKISFDGKTLGSRSEESVVQSCSTDPNDSSFINDMSLDKIVDAILDTSGGEPAQKEAEKIRRSTNDNVRLPTRDIGQRSQEQENELNETQEENLINTEHERLSEDRNSSDSGFRSSTTEQLHCIGANFVCRCQNNQNDSLKVQKSSPSSVSIVCDKTIIAIDDTFNERCVDVTTRKRASSSPSKTICEAKRQNVLGLDNNKSVDDNDFNLRRQKCIRRRKLHEESRRSRGGCFGQSSSTDEDGSSIQDGGSIQGGCLQGGGFTQNEGFMQVGGSVQDPDLMHGFVSTSDRGCMSNGSFMQNRSYMQHAQNGDIQNGDTQDGGFIKNAKSTQQNCSVTSASPVTDFVTGCRFPSRRYSISGQDLISARDTNESSAFPDDFNDNSFESSMSEKCNETTPEMKGNSFGEPRNHLQETYIVETPSDHFQNIRRTRRCLLFDSPTRDISSAEKRTSKVPVVDLNMQYQNGSVMLTVIRCRDLSRTSGKQINAYVKVALSERFGDSRKKQRGALQRTAVHADSCRPFFNHTFKLPLHKADFHKRAVVEVWHRDRAYRRSEFLGCTSFAVKNVIRKNISGSYRLLPQSTGRFQNVPITVHHSVDHPVQAQEKRAAMCESQSSIEEIISIDEVVESDLKMSSNKSALSQQQKDADENLFLRYLELDPTEGPDAVPAALQRKATGNKNGRTPFTTTKKLIRPPKTGFGFSVVWTHPPRVERVEKGLPAEKAGILPGDYIIFVDKHNVVMMPEIDILNLIRSYGNQLTLEIFRRGAQNRNGSVPSVRRLTSAGTGSTPGLPAPSIVPQRRPSTVCSTNTTSVDYNRRKLQLPQVTFSAERTPNSPDEARKKAFYQLISKEQQYATGLQFALTRFVSALAERIDLITPTEHRILFQNSDELLHITEDILDTIIHEDGDVQIHMVLKTYQSKLPDIKTAYKKYCSGIKKADCVLANKSRNSNSDFVRFLQIPAIPRRRPDITVFIHKPLEHFREILKLFNIILSFTKSNQDDYSVISQIVHDLQLTYREITAEAGLMEPVGEGRPLLSVQDLENRLVFTKCKPFVLNKPGRQWIFGGDLSRVEGRNVRQYWTLLFSDLLLFAKVSRDRVLFIIEDPLPLSNISEMLFNVRKKATEFRITVEPGGKSATSPTVHCGPDLTRTPKKNAHRRCVVLRAPTTELKAVWQNLLQRQIFHVNAGTEGSSFSSPIESPEAPITSSVATLQSQESLSLRRQTPHCLTKSEKTESQKQLDELIEHKCKQLSKSSTSSKSNAIHLEQWMKGQLGSVKVETPVVEDEHDLEVWTEEMFRKRSEELQLIDQHGNAVFKAFDMKRCESRVEEIVLSDHDQSPSRTTSTESQVTVRSSPVVPEQVSVCRQCHKTCLTNNAHHGENHDNNANRHSHSNSNMDHNKNFNNSFNDRSATNNGNFDNGKDDDGDWQSLMLMGLSAININPAVHLVKLDPFAAPVPKIAVVPPTPDTSLKSCDNSEFDFKDNSCRCQNNNPGTPRSLINEIILSKDFDASPDDSPQAEEQPYHSLSSSNLTLRRFGTVSSLERLAGDDGDIQWHDNEHSSESEDDEEERGIDNEAFNHNSIRSWTARAGSYVAEKMAFFERFSEDYKGGFFERYLKTTEIQVNGDDVQEEETSGATSGEEIWGTPTSGGEMEDPLSSPNYDGRNSPNDDSLSSENGEDTELMMDELLMTPPVTAATIRGLLPRRTLEPLMEEEYSDTYSSSSSTPTEPSPSPDQGKGIGDVADKYSSAAETTTTISPERDVTSSERLSTPTGESLSSSITDVTPRIHRSESYRHIIDQEDENASFFNRFRPAMKFVNIERIPRAKGVKFLEFFNVKLGERRIHERYPNDAHLVKVFNREGDISDEVPTAYGTKPVSPRRLKDKQLDRRFWKQLSKRRSHKPVQLSA